MTPATDRVAAALAQAFESECRALHLVGELVPAASRLDPRFASQFGAESEWIVATFLDELGARGIDLGAATLTTRIDEPDLARLGSGLREALRRTRARLVDANSWNAGGIPWPFPMSDARIRDRGIALYRAPAKAEAVVACKRGLVTITFPRGDCGEVVSAGIWVPTCMDGDFEVEVGYRLPTWRAGQREACLGLFAVAPDGGFRVYAQRVAGADASARVVADVDGVGGPVVEPCSSDSGLLKIAREAGLISIWSHEGDRWTWLGRARTALPLIVGAKVWALGVCGPLRAELRDFRLLGDAAREQIPLPPPRPDPRQAS